MANNEAATNAGATVAPAAPAAPTAPVAPAASAPRLTLTEFCIRLSEQVKSPELIGGFENTERRAGHLKDTQAAFKARYDAFVNQPV